MPIPAQTQAPNFSLPDENGNSRTLSEFKGKPVVLYFYPKDDTPGCTTEACNFRDDYGVYQKNGVVILGVSPDDARSHAKFKNKYDLPFTLLADEGHKVCSAYGVWGLKKLMGREYEGVLRTTFVIGPDGKVLKVFEGVKPEGHSAQVLEAIKEVPA